MLICILVHCLNSYNFCQQRLVLVHDAEFVAFISRSDSYVH